jgi:hypothetical protein
VHALFWAIAPDTTGSSFVVLAAYAAIETAVPFCHKPGFVEPPGSRAAVAVLFAQASMTRRGL